MGKVVFSIDFDDCGRLLILDDLKSKHRGKMINELKDLGYNLNKSASIEIYSGFVVKKGLVLDAFLTKLANDTAPEILCGSARQSRWIDNNRRRAEGLTSHSALDDLSEYAQRKNWCFNRFLLADVYLEKEPGYAYENAVKSRDFLEYLDQNKTNMLTQQLKHIAAKYPKDTIDFYFFDDYWPYFKAIQAYFLQNSNQLPPNIKLHLVNYKYQHGIESSLNYYRSFERTDNSREHEPQIKEYQLGELLELAKSVAQSISQEWQSEYDQLHKLQQERAEIERKRREQAEIERKQLELKQKHEEQLRVLKNSVSRHPLYVIWQQRSEENHLTRALSIIKETSPPLNCCHGFFARNKQKRHQSLRTLVESNRSSSLKELANNIEEISRKTPLTKELRRWVQFFYILDKYEQEASVHNNCH